jgi:ABC-type nitrate/sulfonate/bicarbonate transport system substrate-binding protein
MIRVLIAIMALLSIASTAKAAERVKILYSSYSALNLPLWIAKEARIFQGNGLDVSLVYVSSGTTTMQALLAGQAEIASMAPAAAVNAWRNGAAVVIVAGGIEKVLFAVVSNPKLEKIGDLRGKKLGISRFGSLTDVALRKTLLHYGLDGKEATLVQTGGTSERIAALSSGAIDAGIFNLEHAMQLEKKGFRTIADLRQLFSFPTQSLVTSRSYLDTNPNAIKRTLKSYVEGIRTVKSNEGLTMTVLAKMFRSYNIGMFREIYQIYSEAFEKDPFVYKDNLAGITESIPGAELESIIDNRMMGIIIKELAR